MSRGLSLSFVRRTGLILLVAMYHSSAAQERSDAYKLLEEADRLAWLKVWTRAAPIYVEAEKLFAALGEHQKHRLARRETQKSLTSSLL